MLQRISLVALCTILALAASPLGAKELPKTTKDGLELVKQHELGAVYVKPGASLQAYDKIILVDTAVAFAKNWQRDFNEDHMRGRISDKDMQVIKQEVAKEFKARFTKVLEKGGYKITETIGPDAMVLRPAIVDLEVTAPRSLTDLAGAVVVRDAGELTLYMEIYDSVTSSKFAEVIDREVAGSAFATRADPVSNKAALDRVLDRWADLLRKRLDEAHGKK
jgi:hypothetical protein